MQATIFQDVPCVEDSENLDFTGKTIKPGHEERPIIRWRQSGMSEARQFRGKLYEDIEFKPLHITMIEDVTLKGKWDMELTDDSDNAFLLRFVHRVSGDSLVLTFPSQSDRKRFAESIVSLGDVQQVTPGMDLEGLVQKARSSEKRNGVLGHILTAAVTAGLYAVASKMLKKRKPLYDSMDEAFEPSRS